MGVASGVNPEDKPGDEDGPKLCSTSFCLLLQQRRYIAILASTFPLDNISGEGRHAAWAIANLKNLHPREGTPVKPHRDSKAREATTPSTSGEECLHAHSLHSRLSLLCGPVQP